MSGKRPLRQKELELLAENISDNESIRDPYEDSGSEYIQSEHYSTSDSELDIPKKRRHIVKEISPAFVDKNETDSVSSSSDFDLEINGSDNDNIDAPLNPFTQKADLITWTDVDETFVPRMKIPEETSCVILADLNRGSSELEIFMKLFPKSLFNYIAQCTNQRLQILEQQTKKKQTLTDSHEIMIAIGCFFIMAYNKLPAIHNYWSSNKSLGNEAIKTAISRDRFQLLTSKLYFNDPKKPQDCSKIYYIEDVVSCLKKTYALVRSDSKHQSIDEAMAKFKGRSTLKQFQPMKPIKRGVKIWERCDSSTGYVYDFNIYSGKEDQSTEGTLGERVVKKLTETVKEPDVSFCFDRFFTSVNLMDTSPFSQVGTCISTRKNMPKFEKKKRNRGDIESKNNNNGTIGFLWKDTKEVMVLSNCHTNKVVEVSRKGKDGTKINVPCPEAIQFYNAHMGGVDLSDQLTGLYDIDRKSLKWWKKVFYKLLLTTAVNGWIVYKELHNKPKLSFLSFLVNLAETLVSIGRKNASVVRKRSYGRSTSSSKNLINVGDHLPIMMQNRRRCRSCTQKKVETRTKTMCSACDIPLCNRCFSIYHT